MSQIQSGILNQVRMSGLDVNDRAWQATTGAAINAERERAAHTWSADGLWTTLGKGAGEVFSLGLYDAGPRSGISAAANFFADSGLPFSDFGLRTEQVGELSGGTDSAGRKTVNRDEISPGMFSSIRRSARFLDRADPQFTPNEAVVAMYGVDDQGELFDEDTLLKMFTARSEFELATRRAVALREREIAIRKRTWSPAANMAVTFAGGFTDPATLASGMLAGRIGNAASRAFVTTEIAPGIVLPGTASTIKNLAARNLIAGAENIGQGVLLADLAGQDYNWHDAMRDMAFGATFGTAFGTFGTDGAISQAAEIRTLARRFKELSSVLSAIEHGAELTDRGALFYQHVPGLTRTSTPLDVAAAEMAYVADLDHVERAGGGGSNFGWLVGRKVQMDGIGEVQVTGIDGRDVIGTIDGREVKMNAAGVSIDRYATLENGTRVRLDDGTLGTVETIVTESTPFADATRVPRRGDATTTVRVVGDDGKVHNLNPDELLVRSGTATVRRGQVVFDPNNAQRAIVAFGKARNASTLAHETGHVFRRTLRDIDGELAAKIDEHYGQNGQNWTVDAEERFARDFEQYMKEGKAPTKELATTFERFAAWLSDLWESIGGNKSQLTDVQREAFGRLLDSDKSKPIVGELGGKYAATRDSLRRVLGKTKGSTAVNALMLANAKAWSRATGRNIDDYFEQVVAGFTGSLRNPFHAPIRQLPPRTIIVGLEPPTSKGELGTTVPDAPVPQNGVVPSRENLARDTAAASDSPQAQPLLKQAPDTALIGREAKQPWEMTSGEWRDWSNRPEHKVERAQAEKVADDAMAAVVKLEEEVGTASKSALGSAGSAEGISPQAFGLAALADELRAQAEFDEAFSKMPEDFKQRHAAAVKKYEVAHARYKTFESLRTAQEMIKEHPELALESQSPNTALIGRESKLVLGNGRVLAVKYAIIDADRLIPSNDARKGFVRNEAGDLNERPYHDPTEGKASREKVYAIADNPDTSQIINDAPTSNVGPPIVGPNGVVYGGNARSMGIQVAYSRGGPGASAIRTATLAAADRFGIERATADGIKNPVLVRMVSATDAGKPGELSRALNEDVATGRTADADAVSRGRLVKPDTASSISTAIGDRSIDEALRDPKTAMQIMKAMRDDGAVSDKDISMFVQGDTLNNEGKLTVKRTLLGVVIPDVRTLAETPPSIENVFIRALGPLVRLLQDTRGKASDFRLTIDDALRALADYRRGDFDSFNQMLMEPAGFTPEPWRDNPTGIAFARIIAENKPTEVYRILNSMADEAAEAKSGQVMLGADKPPEIEEIIGKHLGIDVLAQDKNPNELAQDVLDLTDTLKSEDRSGALPLGGAKGQGLTGGRAARVEKAPRTSRVAILKGFDHPLLNVVTNAIFQDPLLDSAEKRSNASAEQFDSLHMHTKVDGYLRQMHDHVTGAATAAGIGRINIPKRMKFETEFREKVGRLVRDRTATSATIADPHLRAAVETTRKTLREIGQLGKDNFVKNFDKFALDDNYLTRQWAFDKLHAMEKAHPGEVSNLFARAVMDAQPALTPAEARVVGDLLRTKLFTHGKEAGIDRNAFAAGFTNREHLLRVLKENGVNPSAAVAIADKVAMDKDNTATLSVAKRRTLINEKATIRTASGATIGIEDLLNNDAMAIVHGYGQQVIAEAAMTQVRRQIGAKVGMKFDTDAGLLEFLSSDMRNAGYSQAEVNKAMYLVETGVKRLRGIAIEDSGTWTDNLWRVRQGAAIAGNGAFGIPAAFELGHAITRLGVRATLANMPAVYRAWRELRTGNVNDPALKAMLYTVGVGHDSVSARYFGSWEHATDPYQTNPEGRLAKFDKGLSAVARQSRFASLVPQITELSRLMAANGVQHKLVQQALSGKQPSTRRLAWLGMDQTRWDNVAKMIQANHKKGAGGLVDVQLDGGGWTDAQAKHDYIEAVRSQVNTIVQEGGIGASHPWLETEAGKVIFQFRQFGIMAYQRQTLAQYQIGDSDAIGRGMVAAVPFGMMQYMAATYLNSLGRDDRDEYLDKMLTPDRMAIAAFSRASFSSIGPVIYDSFAATAGFETLGGFRSSGLESDPLLGNPTFSIITAGRKGLGGGLRSMIDPDYDLSDENIRGIRTVVPFSRLPGTSLMWNQILNQTPSHSVNKIDNP